MTIRIGDVCKIRRGNPGEGKRCILRAIHPATDRETQVEIEWVIGGGRAVVRATEICGLKTAATS